MKERCRREQGGINLFFQRRQEDLNIAVRGGEGGKTR